MNYHTTNEEMKVEVFKTNVNYLMDAEILVRQIRRVFPGYTVSFDLEDCDRILRIATDERNIASEFIIDLLEENFFHAEILDDNIIPAQNNLIRGQS